MPTPELSPLSSGEGDPPACPAIPRALHRGLHPKCRKRHQRGQQDRGPPRNIQSCVPPLHSISSLPSCCVLPLPSYSYRYSHVDRSTHQMNKELPRHSIPPNRVANRMHMFRKLIQGGSCGRVSISVCCWCGWCFFFAASRSRPTAPCLASTHRAGPQERRRQRLAQLTELIEMEKAAITMLREMEASSKAARGRMGPPWRGECPPPCAAEELEVIPHNRGGLPNTKHTADNRSALGAENKYNYRALFKAQNFRAVNSKITEIPRTLNEHVNNRAPTQWYLGGN